MCYAAPAAGRRDHRQNAVAADGAAPGRTSPEPDPRPPPASRTGPAGEVIAGRLAERGRRVAVVERHLIGGECSFYACMPSKALLRPAEVLAEVARIPGAAQAVTGSLDVQAVLARRDEVIHNLDDSGQLPWLKDRGIELFRGDARLEGERRVRVGEDVLVARDAV